MSLWHAPFSIVDATCTLHMQPKNNMPMIYGMVNWSTTTAFALVARMVPFSLRHIIFYYTSSLDKKKYIVEYIFSNIPLQINFWNAVHNINLLISIQDRKIDFFIILLLVLPHKGSNCCQNWNACYFNTIEYNYLIFAFFAMVYWWAKPLWFRKKSLEYHTCSIWMEREPIWSK